MTAPRERLVDVPGGRVWTATYGDGPGPALLVLHGGPGMPSHYLTGLSELASDRPVVLFDQLGCGRSDRPDDPSLWTVPRAVAEVDAVRSELALARVDLLGHSWGGYLALAYAHEHPPDVSSLVLSSPLVAVAEWMEDAAELVARLPEWCRRDIARHEEARTFEDPAYLAATAEFYRRFFCSLDPWPPELDDTFAGMGEQAYRTLWGPSEFTQTGTLSGHDLSATLEELTVPSLWLCGTRDEVAVDRLGRFASRAGGRLQVLDGGTHCVHLEQPRAYLGLVREFLRGVGAQAT